MTTKQAYKIAYRLFREKRKRWLEFRSEEFPNMLLDSMVLDNGQAIKNARISFNNRPKTLLQERVRIFNLSEKCRVIPLSKNHVLLIPSEEINEFWENYK